jgi:hypothetical protein
MRTNQEDGTMVSFEVVDKNTGEVVTTCGTHPEAMRAAAELNDCTSSNRYCVPDPEPPTGRESFELWADSVDRGELDAEAAQGDEYARRLQEARS